PASPGDRQGEPPSRWARSSVATAPGTGTPAGRTPGGRGWRDASVFSARRASVDDGLDPVVREVDDEGDRDDPHERVDLGELAPNDLEQHPAEEPAADADVDVVLQ